MLVVEESRGLSFYLYYYYLKSIGLCPFSLDRERLPKFSCLGALYNILILSLYSWDCSKSFVLRSQVKLVQDTPLAVIMDNFGTIWTSLGVISSWLVFTCRLKSLRRIFRGFLEIEDLQKELRIHRSKNSVKEEFRKAGSHFVIVNVMYLVYLSSFWTVITVCQDIKNQAFFWFFYNLPTLVHFNVVFILLQLIILLRKHYEILNDELIIFRNRHNTNSIGAAGSEIFSEKLHLIGHLHANLTDLCQTIVDFFSLPVLFMLASWMGNIILPIHGIYRYLGKLKDFDVDRHCIIVGPVMKALTFSVLLFFTCSVPVWTADQANKTAGIIDQVFCKRRGREIDRKAVKRLMLQLLQKRLTTSVFGLFNLDYDLLQNICTTMITYLVCMVQLDNL